MSELAYQSLKGQHYREVFWYNLGRMALLYFMPLLLLTVFFQIEYRRLLRESLRAHLEVIAEHQAKTFDLFLLERAVNLENLIDDPLFPGLEVDEPFLGSLLEDLRLTSDAFVDLGVVSGSGDLVAYVGPVNFPSLVSYENEEWFIDLLAGDRSSIITEIYLGFRDQPHFTIAVRRQGDGGVQVLRSTLSPERLADYLTTLEGAGEVHSAIVNGSGVLQVTTPQVGEPLGISSFVPPQDRERGFVPGRRGSDAPGYAFAWLGETPWAFIVTSAGSQPGIGVTALPRTISVFTVAIFVLMGFLILFRARKLAERQLASEKHEAELSGQLVQAAKLASVGELAAGIAHEINNPLAIIAEEVGVMQDALDPELIEEDDEPLDVPEHLEAIHEAVFRCRDITRKLLTFVRQAEVKVEPHLIREILDEVLEVMLGNELALSNVEVVRRYDYSIPEILTDRNQLIQVFLNLVKNAMDAMPGGGTLTLTTVRKGERAAISIRDTGCGMTPDQMERVFVPFFTTKDPGKGTGLGLSVSYSIIQSFGGAFYVASAPGEGSTFTVELPLVVS
jgi:two-component system NtrC family sensor kinase